MYLGPAINLYLGHYKLLVSSGIQGNDEQQRLKTRLGIGYDIMFGDNLMLVPGLALDFIDHQTHPVASLGI